MAVSHFEARTSAESGQVVVSLAGEADLSVRDELTSVLLAAVATSPVVIVDLEALAFLDSTGLYGLMTAYQAARQGGTQLYVVNAGGVVAEVLHLTGVADLLRPPGDVRTSPDADTPPAG